jgi:hypothetical protein
LCVGNWVELVIVHVNTLTVREGRQFLISMIQMHFSSVLRVALCLNYFLWKLCLNVSLQEEAFPLVHTVYSVRRWKLWCSYTCL